VRIIEVALFRVDLPLTDPFQHASSGLITALEEVVAAIRTEDGIVGHRARGPLGAGRPRPTARGRPDSA